MYKRERVSIFLTKVGKVGTKIGTGIIIVMAAVDGGCGFLDCFGASLGFIFSQRRRTKSFCEKLTIYIAKTYEIFVMRFTSG